MEALFQLRRIQIALFLLVVLAGALFRLANLQNVGRRSPDERVYSWEAAAIAEEGTAGLQKIVTQFEKNSDLFLWPSPVRAGYLWIQSGIMHISGHRDPLAGAILSSISGIFALALLGTLVWRSLGPAVALPAMLLYAASPPVLMMARRGWQEPFVECFGVLLLLSAVETLRRRNDYGWLVCVGVLAGASITIKEIAVLDSILILMGLSAVLAAKREWRKLGVLAATTGIVAFVSAVWLAHVLGSFAEVMLFFERSATVAGSSSYAVAWQTGSAGEWIRAIWLCDPLAVSLGFVGVGVSLALSRRSYDSPASYVRLGACGLVLFFCFLPVVMPHHYNLRFIAPAFAPLCLLGAVGLAAITGRLKESFGGAEGLWARRFAWIVFVLTACLGYKVFQERFVSSDLQDLSLKMVQQTSLQD